MNGQIKSKVNKKLRSNAGESLAETLVALLIAALAVAMLAGVVVAASGMVRNTRDKLDAYYDANERVVVMSDDDDKKVEATVTINDRSSGSSDKIASRGVLCYRNDVFNDNPVVAYRVKGQN